MRLLRDGEEVTLQSWALEIIDEMHKMCEVIGIEESHTLNLMHERILNPDLTYGRRLLELIRERGFVNTHTMLSINNKKTSKDIIKNMKTNNVQEYEKCTSNVLIGK